MHHTFGDMSYSFNLRIKNVEYILVDPCPGKVAQGHCSVLLHHFLSNDDFKISIGKLTWLAGVCLHAAQLH